MVTCLTLLHRYYVHPPESLYRDVVLLLPYSQVLQLVNEIATTFKVEVSVPGSPFTLSFFDDGTPQPQLLGNTKSRADINDMQDSIPPPAAGHGEPPANATEGQDISFAAFKRKMEKAAAANKKKNAAVKKKKAQDRFLTIQDWVKQLRRAQRYFGLRPAPSKVPEPDPNMTWAEQESFIKQNEMKAGVILDPLDAMKPAPFAFEKEPIIVSIDLESYERNHGLITEIGISTLDTLDLIAEPPGRVGANWMKHIRSRHFRIKDREHYVNKDFVRGHPEAFQFGESEFVSLENAGKAVDSCFEWPFSVQYKHDGRLKNVGDDWDTRPTDYYANDGASTKTTEAVSTSSGENHANGPSATCTNETISSPENPSKKQRGPRQRTIILLGHDLGTDLAYLTKLNSRVFSAPRPPTYPAPLPDPSDMDNPIHSILEALDTATLYKVFTRDTQTKSLTSIMAELGRAAWYAHNGGNDARYTLEALVGLVVKARIQDDEEKAAKAVALRQALEKDTWNADPNGNTTPVAGGQEKLNAPRQDELSDPQRSLSQVDGTASPRTLSPPSPSPWEAEKSRRLTNRLAAARREVEDENNAWDAALNLPHRPRRKSPSGPQPSNTAVDVNEEVDEGGAPIPFSQTLQTTHASKEKKTHKKIAESKRREYQMRVREEDGMSGPVDWAVSGEDGWGK
jgi:hypothetical protein